MTVPFSHQSGQRSSTNWLRFSFSWLLLIGLSLTGNASAQDEAESPADDSSTKAEEAPPTVDSTAVDEAQALAQAAQEQAPKAPPPQRDRESSASSPVKANAVDARASADEEAPGEEALTEPAPKKTPKRGNVPRFSERKDVAALQQKAAHIEALIEERLSLDVDPKTLFQIDLADAETTSLEARWLASILERVNGEAPGSPPEDVADGENAKSQGASQDTESSSEATSPEGTTPVEAAEAKVIEYANLRKSDPELWRARLALDRARLIFFSLSKDKRASLLERHVQRQNENEQENPDAQLTDAERKAAEADAERNRALQAARDARSEAARLVAEERARLLDVAKHQAEFEAELVTRRERLKAQEDDSLALQRRGREVLAQARKGEGADRTVDRIYEEIRDALGATRQALGRALGQLMNKKSDVPAPGKNRLEGILQEVDQSEARRTREAVERTQKTLESEELALWADVAEKKYNDMEALDDLRLELVPFLSEAERLTVTGLGPGGLEQALSELEHVILVLRYHHNATTRWLEELTKPSSTRGKSALTATLIALKWVLPVFLFIWWRRRAEKVLLSAERRVREEVATDRMHTQDSHPAMRAIHLAQRIRNPLEWLLLTWAFVWFLPPEAKGLLEVELVRTIFTWTLSGSIAVRGIDFLAGEDDRRFRRKSVMLSAHLRLRSLRLVGRAVVAFGLILGLTNQLVGRGTIYSWVFTLLWFASAAIFLVLVKWWRNVIFERLATKRKKTRLDHWVTANQTGWKSFVAALIGGTALFTSGAYRAVRSRISSFSVTRKFLAYLFQRDMSRQAEEVKEDNCQPLDGELYRKLSPMVHSDQIVPSVADQQVDELISRINAPGGGVFAIVGERGGGKTTLLRRITERADDIVRVQTPYGDSSDFEKAFLKAVTGNEQGSLAEASAAFDSADRDAGILIDNAHRLIRPTVGGFSALDGVLSMARTHSKNIAWVFAFDEVIWRLLQRMRGTKPLFDDVIRIAPWSEEGIVSLLTSRNEAVGIEPSFDQLVGELPEDADAIDHDEALAQTEENYLRLLWHYSAGNPGLAMHAWRMSLGINEAGAVQVRVFQSPNPGALEGLPDASLFVMRAIVQMERASIEQICEITHLPAAVVQDVVRYGRVKGYITESKEGIGITWTWFRAVTKLLQRRHLLYPAHD